MAPLASKATLLTLVAAIAACTQETPEQTQPRVARSVSSSTPAEGPAKAHFNQPAVSPTTPERATVPHVEQESRWRFDVPPLPVRVESMRFDPTTPPHKIKERFELTQDNRLLVRIDVWANPEALPLIPWMEVHASHLQKAQTRPQQRSIGIAGVPAIIVDQPRSGQAHNIITAVFALDGHVVAVTCADGESPAAVRAFETVLGTFGTEGGR